MKGFTGRCLITGGEAGEKCWGYKLIGDSISVDVVAELLRYLLFEKTSLGANLRATSAKGSFARPRSAQLTLTFMLVWFCYLLDPTCSFVGIHVTHIGLHHGCWRVLKNTNLARLSDFPGYAMSCQNWTILILIPHISGRSRLLGVPGSSASRRTYGQLCAHRLDNHWSNPSSNTGQRLAQHIFLNGKVLNIFLLTSFVIHQKLS